MAVPLVLDTDIGSDVDDALALALALRHPDIDLRAVTTVSADTTARARIAARLLAIDGRSDVEVAAGVRVPGDERNWTGHEGEGLPPGNGVPLSDRGAVELLTELAPGTVMATIGMQSNIAASVQRDPAFVERVGKLAVMGGAFAPMVGLDGSELDASRDWNLVVDPEGASTSLNAGFSILYTPCDVTMRLPLRRAHLDRLRHGDDLCRTLAALVDVWYEHVLAPHASAPGDVVALLHDPLAVACVVDRSMVTIETLPVKVIMRDGVPRTVIDPVEGRDAEVVRSVDAAAFAEWWLDVVAGA